ncbi:hypothetical protein EV361DRAFT_945418 [Lentinula raphanica]|nr:hypothetical protein EV361DRAFT_945418 [Lentinula raphanica]
MDVENFCWSNSSDLMDTAANCPTPTYTSTDSYGLFYSSYDSSYDSSSDPLLTGNTAASDYELARGSQGPLISSFQQVLHPDNNLASLGDVDEPLSDMIQSNEDFSKSRLANGAHDLPQDVGGFGGLQLDTVGSGSITIDVDEPLSDMNESNEDFSKSRISLHVGLANGAHDLPRDVGGFHNLQLDTDGSDSLETIRGVVTLDASSAVQLMRSIQTLAPEFQESLSNVNTSLATAMEPPMREKSFNQLGYYRSIGGINDAGNIYRNGTHGKLFALDPDEAIIKKYLGARPFAPFAPFDPDTFHFVLLLLEPGIPPSPADSVASAPFDSAPQVSSATIPTTSVSPSLLLSPSPGPSSPAEPSPSAEPSPPAQPSPPSSTHTLETTPVSLIFAWNLADACYQVHRYVPLYANYRDWLMPPAGVFIKSVRGWQATLDILTRMGYRQEPSLASQSYRWLDGTTETFEEIVIQLGWTPKVFRSRSKHLLWAAEAAATRIWNPDTVPIVNPNITVTAYQTWLRIEYIWGHSPYLKKGKPDRRSSNQAEASAALLCHQHFITFSTEISKNLIPRPT